MGVFVLEIFDDRQIRRCAIACKCSDRVGVEFVLRERFAENRPAAGWGGECLVGVAERSVIDGIFFIPDFRNIKSASGLNR